MVLPYVYKITNTKTGEFYIGSRFYNTKLNLPASKDLLVKYFTSGVMKTHLKETPENFIAQILLEHEDYDVCYWYEQLLIRENIKNPLCKNRNYLDPDTNIKTFHMAGKPGPNKGRKFSQEARQRMSEASATKGKSRKFTQQHLDNCKSHLSKNNTTILTCPHCHKNGNVPNMKRWHFSNCKSKSG